MNNNCFARHFHALIAAAALALVLSACAAMVASEPANFTPVAAAAPLKVIRLSSPVALQLSTGFSRTLPAASRWQAVGSLPQGAVYRPVDGVFSIEGRHVHEAYLVVQGSMLRGFYLPAEYRFSPLQQPVSLPLEPS